MVLLNLVAGSRVISRIPKRNGVVAEEIGRVVEIDGVGIFRRVVDCPEDSENSIFARLENV